jgi:hypothetical protein
MGDFKISNANKNCITNPQETSLKSIFDLLLDRLYAIPSNTKIPNIPTIPSPLVYG